MKTVPMRPDELEPSEDTPSVPNDAEQRYGRYRLCFELASGGMGKVFLARAEGPGGFEKLVALKRIHGHLAKEKSFVDMFLDEARIASRISHPNVCAVFDFGEHDGTYYIAMDYLVGEPLSRVLVVLSRLADIGGWRRIPYGVRIVADACEGLHAAHELRSTSGQPLNIVHRDISPHNLFVTFDGGVKIVDFGIARAADQVHDTTTGSVKGKWMYMSPEQARGKTVDRRTDVWSLGVVLWEILTCRRLFQRSNPTETVLAVVSDRIPAPSEIEPNVPPELDAIVMRALDRDLDARYPDARALGRQLLRWLAQRGEPVGLPDIAEWMDELFPSARTKKRTLLEIAHQAAEPVPRIHTTPTGAREDVDSGVHRPRRSSQLSTERSRPPRASVDALGPTDEARASQMPQARGASRDARAEPEIGTETGAEARRMRSGARSAWLASGSIVLLAMAAAGAFALGAFDGAGNEDVAGEGAGAPREIAEATSPELAAGPDDVIPRGLEPPPEQALAPETPAESVAEIDPAPGSADVEPPPERRIARSDRPTKRPRRAPTVATAGTGVISVVTQGGWALVHHEGRLLGETPGRYTLPAGRQSIEIRPFGREPGRVVRVDVVAGETRRVSVPLTP